MLNKNLKEMSFFQSKQKSNMENTILRIQKRILEEQKEPQPNISKISKKGRLKGS